MSVSKSTKNMWREKTKKKTNKPLIVVQVAHSRALILSQNCFYQVYHLSFSSTTPCSTTCIFWPLQWTHPLCSNTLPFPCRVLIKAERVSWNGEKIRRRTRELLLCLPPFSLLLTNSWSPECKCCQLASRVGSFPENPFRLPVSCNRKSTTFLHKSLDHKSSKGNIQHWKTNIL